MMAFRNFGMDGFHVYGNHQTANTIKFYSTL